MCGPHHCLGRDAFASGREILRRLLQLRQNASVLGQGCAGFSPGSAKRCDQFTRHPGRTSSPLRPRLGCRYTQGLVPLGFILLDYSIGDGEPIVDADRILLRFSSMGYVAVATLIVSGLVNSWFLVGSVSNLL